MDVDSICRNGNTDVSNRNLEIARLESLHDRLSPSVSVKSKCFTAFEWNRLYLCSVSGIDCISAFIHV